MKDAFYDKILNYDCMDMWVHDAKGSCSGTSFGKLITVERFLVMNLIVKDQITEK